MNRVIPMKNCRGDSCQQGRMPCQTPQACEIAEEDDESAWIDWTGLFLAVLALMFVLGMIWVVGR